MNAQQINCRNCGELLTGPYCSHCGQREGRGDLSFADLASELLDELFNWDSRLWRTLVPLVFRPGFLTAEFIAGRRARYVPPFRLYLIISFVLFLVLSVLAGDTLVVQTDGDITASPGLSVSSDREDTMTTPIVSGDKAGEGEGEDAPGVDMAISLSEEDSPHWLEDLDDRLERNVESLSGNPDEFIQLLREYLPQMMFLLLPAFALVLKFCYLFSPFHYLQHLVFTLHFNCFVYLLFLMGQLGHLWWHENAVTESFPLLILVYLPLALRRAYGSGLAGAAGKAIVILVVDSLLLLIAFAALAVMALALM